MVHSPQRSAFAALAAVTMVFHAPTAFSASSGGGSADFVEVFVPRAVIYPGSEIVESLLDKKSIANKGGFAATVVTTSDEIAGLVARRTLIPGQAIAKDAVRPPMIIQKGQPVTIYYTDGPISIALGAVSIQSGGVGDTIAVRNSDTGKILRATIRPNGTLSMNVP